MRLESNILADIFQSRRLPLFLQSHSNESALACLAMIASYHGYELSLNEIRRHYAVSLKGMTLNSIIDLADTFGLTSRPLHMDLDSIGRLKLPAILHWNLSRYVVLREIRGQKLFIHDPAVGIRKITFKEANDSFTGVALELTPTAEFSPRKAVEKTSLTDLFRDTRGIIHFTLQLFALAFAAEMIALLSPLLNQMIVDDVLARGDKYLLAAITVGMVGLLIITQIISIISGYINMYIGTQLSFQMQTQMLRHILRLPVSWFEARRLGDVMSRFSSLDPARRFLSVSISDILLNGVMGMLALVMMIIYSPLLAGAEFAVVIILFIGRLAVFPWYREKQLQGLHLGSRVQSTFIETLRCASIFKVFAAEHERVAVWQNEQAFFVNNSVEIAKATIWGAAGKNILSKLQIIISWTIGATMIISGKMTLGMLIAFQAYLSQFSDAAMDLAEQYFGWKTLGIHLERLADVTHAQPEIGLDNPASLTQLQGAIEALNVSFRYAQHEPWILNNVSFKINVGDFVCLIGPSGQGKTTLLKLLLGFYDPEVGEVLVDQTPIRKFGLRSYRQGIGVVMQDDRLLWGNIADNIAFFQPGFDMADVEQAAKAAQIHEDILRLPMGYQSHVGDMGSALSGGQRQRLFIARALYRKPKILFLDEGTANLDIDNERRLMSVLSSLNITRVFVAHREIAVAAAKRLLRVCDGDVIEIKQEARKT